MFSHLCRSRVIRRHQKLYVSSQAQPKKKLIFLGTPTFAADCLQKLLNSSKVSDSSYQVSAVVTRPPNVITKNITARLSPVHKIAYDSDIPVFTPDKASDPSFIRAMSELQPDLCITAAYGNYLPSNFLTIPKFGTLNIHPSLLPLYRGASPVQRALERGESEVGVTVLFSVKKMDAGPILCQEKLQLKGHEKSTEVVQTLFDIGLTRLLESLPLVWSKETDIPPATPGGFEVIYDSIARAQCEKYATAAPKIKVEEGAVTLAQLSARQIHNKCRAFADWPGVWTHMTKVKASHSGCNNGSKQFRVKIVTTAVLQDTKSHGSTGIDDRVDQEMRYVSGFGSNDVGYFEATCGDGSRLAIYELQPDGKKVMTAKSFQNGLKDSKLFWNT